MKDEYHIADGKTWRNAETNGKSTLVSGHRGILLRHAIVDIA